MMSKKLCRWELAAFLTAAVIGPLLHFTYAWSGGNAVVGRLFRSQRVHLGAYETALRPPVLDDAGGDGGADRAVPQFPGSEVQSRFCWASF